MGANTQEVVYGQPLDKWRDFLYSHYRETMFGEPLICDDDHHHAWEDLWIEDSYRKALEDVVEFLGLNPFELFREYYEPDPPV